MLCPRLVRVVKESGLVCVSYGTLNNDPENVKLQVAKGIDAVIVDSVLAPGVEYPDLARGHVHLLVTACEAHRWIGDDRNVHAQVLLPVAVGVDV